MAKDRSRNIQQPAAPVPTNRMIPTGTVRVRANIHIHENGYHPPGDTFEIPATRLPALGNQVTRVP